MEHGLDGDPTLAAPLLVIAGAGSGKTKTLAARVARLVVGGADPQRLLLLTFSRRAAVEMTHRVGSQLQRALGLPPGSHPPALPWAGTFHAIGARLLRDYARHIGLSEDLVADFHGAVPVLPRPPPRARALARLRRFRTGPARRPLTVQPGTVCRALARISPSCATVATNWPSRE